jgi:hypothetical protein
MVPKNKLGFIFEQIRVQKGLDGLDLFTNNLQCRKQGWLSFQSKQEKQKS